MMQLSDADQIRFYRQFLGMSQAQLASAMGTTQNSVARWENRLVPISRMVLAHVRALAQLKLQEEIRKVFARLRPELYLCDFEGLFALPSTSFTTDRHGHIYLGVVEIMGHRQHALWVRIDEHEWYGIDREGTATKVDRHFLRLIRLAGQLGDGGTPVKDDPRVQRKRIRRIAARVFPRGEVVFDNSQRFSWIRFRIDDAKSGVMLSTSSGHFHASEIADWTDRRLEDYLCAIGPYFAEKARQGN